MSSGQDYVQAFRERQRKDLNRVRESPETSLYQRQLHERYHDHKNHDRPANKSKGGVNDSNGHGLAWRDSEGDRLDDFGVDEAIDFYDEDDIPLAELLRRRSLGKTTSSSP